MVSTGGTFLEDYVESISTLPEELRNNFTRLRELDGKAQGLIKRLEKSTTACVAAAKKGTKEGWDAYEELRRQNEVDDKECLSICDDKVNLAYQTYELVDQHIRRLDADLKKFEDELKQDRSKAEQPFPGEMKRDKNVKSLSPKGKGRERAEPPSNSKAVIPKKSRPAEGGAVEDENQPNVMKLEDDLPIDPNEPLYCNCRQVSFGEMVACDNPDCPIEWFHFQCVGLTQTPKGKWYCQQCSLALRRGRMMKM